MSDPISWRSVLYDSPVLSSDGSQIGKVREVLGSDSEDIFHGIRVGLGKNRDVLIPADSISSLTSAAVSASLSKAQIEALPPFHDVATYHLASVGWLRKHLGWREDSKSDEEAG